MPTNLATRTGHACVSGSLNPLAGFRSRFGAGAAAQFWPFIAGLVARATIGQQRFGMANRHTSAAGLAATSRVVFSRPKRRADGRVDAQRRCVLAAAPRRSANGVVPRRFAASSASTARPRNPPAAIPTLGRRAGQQLPKRCAVPGVSPLLEYSISRQPGRALAAGAVPKPSSAHFIIRAMGHARPSVAPQLQNPPRHGGG